jgi:hypothetical protein
VDGGVSLVDAGATDAGTIVGSVYRINAPTFDTTKVPLYTGAATIDVSCRVQSTAGYGGAYGTAYTFPADACGGGDVRVIDDTGGATGVLSTSEVSPTLARLWVIDRAMLQEVAAQAGGLGPGLSHDAGQAVFVISHGGVPYAGLSVVGVPGNATVAYDLGPGKYSALASQTGSAGIILLFNYGSGSSALRLADPQTSAEYELPLLGTVPGGVEISWIEL